MEENMENSINIENEIAENFLFSIHFICFNLELFEDNLGKDMALTVNPP